MPSPLTSRSRRHEGRNVNLDSAPQSRHHLRANKVLILAAPVFGRMAAEFANSLRRRDSELCVSFIYTGGDRVRSEIEAGLDFHPSSLWDIEAAERSWQLTRASGKMHSCLETLEAELGVGSIGRIIGSDRRIGAGFVRTGYTRPSNLKAAALANPTVVPPAYVASLYLWLSSLVDTEQPEAMFLYAIAGAPATMLALICESRGIKLLTTKSTRLDSLTLLDTQLGARWSIVEEVANLSRSGLIDLSAESEWAKNWLNSFRKAPSEPTYMERNRQQRAASFAEVASGPISRMMHGHNPLSNRSAGEVREAAQRQLFDLTLKARGRRRRSLIRESQSRSLHMRDLSNGESFIFFPLHVDPEASTMVYAPYLTDQLYVAEIIAKSIPAGTRLVVKENPAMLGRRPQHFYRQLRRMPNVVLVGSERPGVEWVAQSSATVTITGTAALEAIQLGRPVVILGDSPTLGLGSGVLHQPHLQDLPQTLADAMNLKPVEEEELILFLASAKYCSRDTLQDAIWTSQPATSNSRIRAAVEDMTALAVQATQLPVA